MALPDRADHWIIAIGTFLGTATFQRFLAYIASAVPPLKPGAGWWATFAYNLLKGATGIDPNATTLSPTTMANMPASVTKQVTAAAEKQS